MDTIDSGLPGGNSTAGWYDTWDRQAGQSFANAAKGLRNAPGENNCFLNSAVQVFWHIDVFRRSYRRITGHLCMGHSCIFCALKVIFTQFQYSDQSSLQPSALRKALADTFAKQERFQLGHMDDAAECFENILNRIHYHIANQHHEDNCTAPHCIPHQKFAMTVFDQLVCPCGAQSEPHKFYEMVHYISANALVSQSRTMQENGDMLHPSRFGLLLRNAGAIGDVRDCPNNCGKKVQIRRTLLNVPDVVSVGLVWGSDKADPELAAEVTRTIGTMILFPDMFHSVMCNDGSQLPKLQLTAVVCYYGKHYSTFIFHTKIQAWIFFDDAHVRQVGPHWEQVVDRISKSRYQPLLLIYTNPNAAPVTTETAPSTRQMAPGYSMTASKDSKEEAKIKPSLPEKSQSSRRVLNSRLEGGDPTKLEKEPLERTSSFEHRRQSSFMLAVTKQKTKDDVIYAVPHNNTKVVNTMKDISQSEMRQMGLRPGNGAGFAGDCVDGMEDPESYNNYTLSNSDHHRRPSLNSPDHSKLPLTPNFSRAGETQKKDSLKKVKGKVGADVIRYPVEGSRRNSQSSESDMSSAAANGDGTVATSNGKPTVPVKPSHFRTRSQSVEDNIAALGEVDIVNNCGSHKVIKPQASNLQTYDGMDSVNRAHTPVQSGLATLPRNKKQGNTNTSGSVDNTVSTSTLMHSQHKPGSQPQPLYQNQPFTHEEPPPPYTPANFSGYQSCLTYQNVVQNDYHSRQGSNSSILSTGTVIECPISDDSHSRQQSTTSQDTLTDKSKPPKAKSKRKEKEEKKKDESGKKSEKKTKSKKEKALKAISEKPPAGHERRDRDEGFSEDRGYIDRKMVESVLNFQKLQRSGSCISQTSNSSLDSERGMRGIVPNDNLSGEIAFDAASIDSHKDSGYASSDRNSSSSTGSITMNPYEQYFLSRNMIPPKTLNQKAMAENMQKLMNKGPVAAGLEYTKEEDLKSLVTNPTEYYHQNYTVGHCQPAHQGHQQQITGQIQGPIQGPPKDVMSLPKSERDQYMFDALNSRGKVTPQHGLDQRFPGQPLPSNKLQQQGPHQSTDCGVPNQYNGQGQGHYVGNHGNHVPFRQAEPQLPSPPANESIPGGNDQFISLCHRAEDLMDSCVLEETSLNYVGALASCQQAIDHLIEARKLPHLTQTSHTYAQRKSNACIIKMRTLQKKLSQQEGSSDSGSSDHRTRQHKPQPQMQVPLNGARPPSRTGSQNSMDSISTNSSSGRCNTPVFDKVMRPPTDERVPPVEPHLPPAEYQNAPYKDRSFETNMPDINNAPTSGNADLYGTLPRWKTQKSQEHMRQGNNEKHEAEVYQDFLDSQRRQSGGHSRNNSGARTPVNEIGPSFDPNQFTRTNKAPNLINPGYNYQNYPQQVIPPPVGHPFPVDQPCTYSRMSQGLKPIPVTPPKIENQSKHTESQPDLRKLSKDSVVTPQRPLTPQVLCTETPEGDLQSQISVRDLKSRFETTSIRDTKDIAAADRSAMSNDRSHLPIGQTNSVGSVQSRTQSKVFAMQRQRSKSESESLEQESQQPKSVLSKKDKTGDRLNKPRKSVTFSTNVCLVEAADDWEGGFHGDQEHGGGAGHTEEVDSSSSSSPVDMDNHRACMLCHKHGIEVGHNYCTKCSFYMNQFQPTK